MKVVFTFLAILLSAFVFANNIQLQKVSLTDTNRTAKTVNIKMNLSWEHSWRDSINWDAAWIIIKYKEPKDSAWKWKHAQLVQSGNNTGTATGVKIVVPDDLTGAFFYRSVIGTGNIASDNIKLLWNYGAAGVTNIDSVEVRVFATEMVYVPQGSFCLGDGNGATRSGNAFQVKNAPNNYAIINDKWSPLINTDNTLVGDDAILSTDGIRISGLNGLDINNDKVAEYPSYPTGYKGYYCMKYKTTQGQYADFLNTVCVNDTTATALNNYYNSTMDPYYPNKYKSLPKELIVVWRRLADNLYVIPSDARRHTIVFDSLQLKFTVTRPDRAYAIMNVNKALSFSEWFGLRPMSELEYEKVCRGPLPPRYGENAWGNDSLTPSVTGPVAQNLTFNGVENGSEYFIDYNITKRYFPPFMIGGDGGSVGPYRVGIFSSDTSSRISSQASYYGIMDLSKITTEIVLPLSIPKNRLFNSSIHGKGVLNAFGFNYGFADVIEQYPSYISIHRYGKVSARGSNFNYIDYGFRAVRSAPSDN